MASKPCKFEIEILREIAGEIEPRRWGAAVGEALEFLRSSGYMGGNHVTDKGRALLSDKGASDG